MKKFFTFFIGWLMLAPAFGQQKSLQFDGGNDYVSAAGKPNVISGNTMTFEAWIKPESYGFPSYLIHKGAASSIFDISFENDIFIDRADGAPGAYLDVNMQNSQGNSFYMGRYVMGDFAGNWHHIAVTLGAGTATLYLDGNFMTSTSFFGSFPALSDMLYIGSGEGGFGYFHGEIDEVRIWNIGRTQTQIRNAMNTELPGNTPGIVAYYRFNEGIANANNTAITQLKDESPTANNAVLNNFTLTGTTSNFTLGNTAIVLPLKNASFTATRKASTIELNWKQTATEKPTVFEIERSGEGLTFSKIGTAISKVTNMESSLTYTDEKPLAGVNYYRLKVIEADDKTTFSNIVAARMSSRNVALQAYPVPAISTLQLEINAPKGAVDIKIRNLAGAVLQKVQSNSTGNTLFMPLDVRALSKGTYIIQVNDQSMLFVKQ